MAEDRAKYFTKTLKCKNRYFGFAYLGLPFRTTKPTLDFFHAYGAKSGEKAVWYY